jgi:LPS export ABC transporter protein LptC
MCAFSLVFIFSGCDKSEKIIIEETPPMCDCTIEKFAITQTESGKLKMALQAESAVTDEDKNKVHLKFPVVKFYSEGVYVSTFIAESADINLKTYDIKGTGECVINTADNCRLQTTNLMYNAKKGLIYSYNNVKFKKCGQIVYGAGFNADVGLKLINIKRCRAVSN